MPLFFLLLGIMLIVVGINNKLHDLGTLVKTDFSPTTGNSFTVWILAIFVVGSLGYIKSFRPVANAFIVLILISMILSNRGFFANFSRTITQGN